MFVRISLIALAAFALTGCDRVRPDAKAETKAPVRAAAAPTTTPTTQPGCCCTVCPVDAAPVSAVVSDDVAASGDTRTARQPVVKPQPVTRLAVSQPSQAKVRRERAYSYAGGYKPAVRSRDSSQRRAYVASDRGQALAGGSYARREESSGGFQGYGDRDTGRYERETGYAEADRRYGQQSDGRYQREQRRYESAQSGYGGRYGASGRSSSGVSISVEETETYAERGSYRESSSGYASSGYASGGASGGGYSTGYVRTEGLYYEDRDGRVRRSGPAGVDRAGYLTWPGKVED